MEVIGAGSGGGFVGCRVVAVAIERGEDCLGVGRRVEERVEGGIWAERLLEVAGGGGVSVVVEGK